MQSIKGYCLIALLSLLASCSMSLDEVSENPNRSEVTNPGNLLTYVLLDTFGPVYYGYNRQIDNYYIDWRFGGSHLNWNRRSFTADYRRLTIIDLMKEEAERVDLKAYIPIGQFLEAYWMFNITRLYGDVPFSQANKLDEGLSNPSYDQQEDIIYSILKKLEEANNGLASLGGEQIQGDVIYDGDLAKWRKLVNMFRLRVLINLTTKTSVKDIDVQDLFAQIVDDQANNPLMGQLDDSPILYEEDNPDNYYIYSNNNFISGIRITQFLAEYMKDHRDVRLMEFAQPTIYAEENDLDPDDFNNYYGTNPWPKQSNNSNYPLEDSKKVSRVNNKYHRNPVGPPTMVIGYPEQQFILAEAALRGWIQDAPDTHFDLGVRASYAFFGIGESEAEAYLSQENVKLLGDEEEMFERIISEKYLNFFMQGGYEPYFEIRRTGYPDFGKYVEPDISTLYNNGNLPLRYLYPLGEVTDNQSNLAQAVSRLDQGDNIFSKMWMIQGEDILKNPSPFPYH
ncbi:SusD/RagB family nutrient-binding outer membrane lipoprotein [Echinicola salinicaeni]|uniref:SusD/RagB family nutrient-binding outer membrane lipoprotein n=1 Tax=Echinicola salinicaeni TaxID=2762757 RepID=UPI001645A7BB|nr:SusD/RagB family nutrient-binding outer membrane lipoprotein [Echinicola salinicaeni]